MPSHPAGSLIPRPLRCSPALPGPLPGATGQQGWPTALPNASPPALLPTAAALRCLTLYLERLGGEGAVAAAAGGSALAGSPLGADMLALLREVLCDEEFLNYRPSGRQPEPWLSHCLPCRSSNSAAPLAASCCSPLWLPCAVHASAPSHTTPTASLLIAQVAAMADASPLSSRTQSRPPPCCWLSQPFDRLSPPTDVPAVTAAAVLLVARKARGLAPYWPAALASLTGYSGVRVSAACCLGVVPEAVSVM